MTYLNETRLIPHYDSHVAYSSHFNSGDPGAILASLGVDARTIETALDLGCGNGNLARWLASSCGVDVKAVDYSARRIMVARSVALDPGVQCEFIHQDLHLYLEENDLLRFDLVALFEVIEHLEEPNEVIDICLGRLTEEGCIVGSVPLNMPYVAHLQVFENLQDVRDRLTPTLAIESRGFAFCRWQ